jgi:predicted transposase YbfD/YdcC
MSKILETLVNQSFLDEFNVLEDPRSTRNRLHQMNEILLATFVGIICGGEGWQDIQDCARAKIEYLRKFLAYKNGAPSDDTYRRFFRHLNPKSLQELLRIWISKIETTVQDQSIAIDGKTSRRTFDDNQSPLHMLTAFASESRLVLGQQKTATKSNEITAIPELLKMLDTAGKIITLDAMGCQYKIADQIIAQKGDYIFSLKGNQGGLLEDVTPYFYDKKEKNSAEYSYFEDFDKGHGRIEIRKCWSTNEIDWLKNKRKDWQTIQSIICIESIRKIKNNESTETRYYISSIKHFTAERFLKAIRSHWSIENSLHWALDMSMGDDYSRIRKGNAPENMLIIKHIILNKLQQVKDKRPRSSIKRLRKMAGWDDTILDEILFQ